MPEDPETSLADLRILDLLDSAAGAFCTKLFAGFGADVIAIEPPLGHPVRREGPFAKDLPHRETGALWLYLGAGKRSVTLDVTTKTGQRLFRRMVEDANVVVESFPPGRMAELGLSYAALTEIKRRIVLVSITPFGQTGPRADWKATNLTSFASGGQMALTGDPDREPLVPAGHQAEYQAGYNAFTAAAIAAYNADTLEVPNHIDIPAQECMASALELYLPWWQYLKRDISKRRGNVLSAIVGLFPAKDGHIAVHNMPRNWPRFAEAMGRPDLIEDERFETGFARLQNNDELEAIVYEWAGRQDAKKVYETAGAARTPIAYVNTLGDVLASEQLASRDFFETVEHPVAGKHVQVGAPFLPADIEWNAGRAPLLGEHNEEVYCEEMGLSRSDLTRLRAAGVV
jgi:crotonobetainyl-CoA:carnitine CoA-transferase CaiB-like acyl-CoA transferase